MMQLSSACSVKTRPGIASSGVLSSPRPDMGPALRGVRARAVARTREAPQQKMLACSCGL